MANAVGKLAPQTNRADADRRRDNVKHRQRLERQLKHRERVCAKKRRGHTERCVPDHQADHEAAEGGMLERATHHLTDREARALH